MIKLIKKIIYTIILSLYFISTQVFAAQSLAVEVVKNQNDNLRIKIPNKQKINFTSSLTEGSLAVKFNKKVSIDVKKIENLTKQQFSSVTLDNDGRTLVFTFKNPGYKFNKSKNKNYLNINLQKKAFIPNAKTLSKDVKKINIPTKNTDKKLLLSNLSKKIKDKEDKKLIPIALKTELPASKANPFINIKNEPLKLTQDLAPNAQIKDQATLIDKNKLSILVDKNPDNSQTWNFNFDSDVAASIFVRSDNLWIIFNKNKDIDFTLVKQFYANHIESAEQIPNHDFTILRIKFKKLDNVFVAKKQFIWQVTIPSDGDKTKYLPKNQVLEYKTPFSQGIFFPINKFSKPALIVTDPIVGDSLDIVTFYDPTLGISNARSYVDFELLPTACGFVTRLISDEINLTLIDRGIEIIVPKSNFTKSDASGFSEVKPGINNDNLGYALVTQPSKSLISFSNANLKLFAKTKASFEKKIANSDDEHRGANYLEYAKFLFSNEFYPDALAAINLAGKDPNSKLSLELKLLKSIVLWKMNRNDSAKANLEKLDEFQVPAFNLEEINFWRNIFNVELNNPNKPIEYTLVKDKFLNDYPSIIKIELGLFSVKENLKDKKDNGDELATLDDVDLIINQLDNNSKLKNSIRILRGEVEYRANNTSDAINLWEAVKKDNKDLENSTIASFLITKDQIKRNKINNKDAIKILESLKMNWRGGNIEEQILSKLAEIYNSEKDYSNALRTWKSLINLYTGSDSKISIASQMSGAFINLFDDKQNLKSMSDLQAVSLYLEFRELTPIGAMGDKIITKLVDRMINLDLLSKAEFLLIHQVDYRLSGVERIKAATKLAYVYLKDKKPNQALEILDKTNNEWLDLDLYRKRMLIRGQAYTEIGEYKNALRILRDDYTNESNDLKIKIFAMNQDWQNVTQILLFKIENAVRENILDENVSNDVARLAITYYLQKDYDSIKSLKNKYSRIIENSPKASEIINYFLIDKWQVDYKNLDKSLNLDALSKFLTNYNNTSPQLMKF